MWLKSPESEGGGRSSKGDRGGKRRCRRAGAGRPSGQSGSRGTPVVPIDRRSGAGRTASSTWEERDFPSTRRPSRASAARLAFLPRVQVWLPQGQEARDEPLPRTMATGNSHSETHTRPWLSTARHWQGSGTPVAHRTRDFPVICEPEVSFYPARWASSLPLITLGRWQFELSDISSTVDWMKVYHLPVAGSSTLVFVFLLSHRGRAWAKDSCRGWLLLSLQRDACAHSAPPVVAVASVEMSVTVDHAKILDLNHLLCWKRAVPHAIDLAFGQMALFGDGVGDLLDSLRDFLTEVQ